MYVFRSGYVDAYSKELVVVCCHVKLINMSLGVFLGWIYSRL